MNPASPFQIGDVVKIIGPGKMGDPSQMGQTFIIERIDGEYYSDSHTAFWYPASSLRKVDELHVGDYAKIILPGSNCGEIHQVIRIDENEIRPFNGKTYPIQLDDMSWWQRSSLRKVGGPELKMGDWVKVIGEPCPIYRGCPEHELNRIFQITQIDERNHEWFSCLCNPTYPASSLRKLTPEEVRAHLHPSREWKVDFYSTDSEAEWQEKRIQVLEHRQKDDRAQLAAIEKRQGAQQNRMDAIEKKLKGWHDSQVSVNSKLRRRCHEAEQRLAFLEKWQMEHDLERTSRFRTKIENIYEQAKTSPRSVAEIAENTCAEVASGHVTLDDMLADGTIEVHDFRKADVKTQRKIIRRLEEELIDGYDGAICEECEDAADSHVDLSIDDRKEAPGICDPQAQNARYEKRSEI